VLHLREEARVDPPAVVCALGDESIGTDDGVVKVVDPTELRQDVLVTVAVTQHGHEVLVIRCGSALVRWSPVLDRQVLQEPVKDLFAHLLDGVGKTEKDFHKDVQAVSRATDNVPDHEAELATQVEKSSPLVSRELKWDNSALSDRRITVTPLNKQS